MTPGAQAAGGRLGQGSSSVKHKANKVGGSMQSGKRGCWCCILARAALVHAAAIKAERRGVLSASAGTLHAAHRKQTCPGSGRCALGTSGTWCWMGGRPARTFCPCTGHRSSQQTPARSRQLHLVSAAWWRQGKGQDGVGVLHVFGQRPVTKVRLQQDAFDVHGMRELHQAGAAHLASCVSNNWHVHPPPPPPPPPEVASQRLLTSRNPLLQELQVGEESIQMVPEQLGM